MPLNPAVHWPDIGKYIGVLNSLTAKQQEFKDDVVAAVEQIDSDWARVTILPAFISNMSSAAQSITNGISNLVAASTDYHLKVLKDEIGSTQTTISGVITDLFSAMNGYSPAQTFKENGNFHGFYRDRYSRLDVPTATPGAETVTDALGD